MNKLIFLFSLMFLFCTNLFSQKLYICEEVTDNGKPIGEAKVFPFNDYSGTDLCFLVKLDKKLECDTIELDIKQQYGFVQTFLKYGLYGEKWFVFHLTLRSAGIYAIDVTDCSREDLLIPKTFFELVY